MRLRSLMWADHWLASDECLELGERVRWFLVDQEHAPRERYWELVLTWPSEPPKYRPVETVQLRMEVA